MAKAPSKGRGRQKPITSQAERNAAKIRQSRGESANTAADVAAGAQDPAPQSVHTAATRRAIAPNLPAGPMKVEATQLGYYGHARRHPGDVFTIANAQEEYSPTWMQPADPAARESITTANANIKRQHDEILGGRIRERAGTGTRESVTSGLSVHNDDDPLGDDD